MNRPDSPDFDGLDRALSKFFESEMPRPWPKAPSLPHEGTISPARPDTPATGSLISSRLSLAASVAMILGGCWFLSSLLNHSPTPNREGSLQGGTASPRQLEKMMKREPGTQPK